ncbi:hypothetical protein BH24PSE2_BH24PSE2_11800 [soil metagenome]
MVRKQLVVIGRFLELSVQTSDVLDSIAFYEALGFRQCGVGDTWRHPYAVMSDGRLFLGLHEYAFDSPALTFVRPDLAAHLPALEGRGVQFAFRKTRDSEFNEAGFTDPDGQMIALLEARTFSPPDFTARDFSALGSFRDYRLPVTNLSAALAFWYSLGALPEEGRDDASPAVEIGGARLGLHDGPGLRQLALRFEAGPARISKLREREYAVSGHVLRSPEGLTLLLG